MRLSKEDGKRLLKRWADPVVFAADVFGVTLWSGQQKFLRACARNRKVATKSCHKMGKTMAFAVLAWWLVTVNGTARVYVLAPRNPQLEEGIWKEIHDLYRRACARGIDIFDFKSLGATPSQGVTWEDKRHVIRGFAADGLKNDPQKMAGLSGENLAYLLDEASAIDIPKIWEVCRTAPGGRFYAISNPSSNDPENEFFKAFGPGSNWVQLHFSAFDVAKENRRLSTGGDLYPGLATTEWIDENRTEEEDSYFWRVRVLGEFPVSNEHAYIGRGLVTAAQGRWTPTAPTSGPLSVGVDVAWTLRPDGDESAITLVRGGWASQTIRMRGKGNQVRDRAAKLISEHRQKLPTGELEEVLINVDTTTGAAIADFFDEYYEQDRNVTVQRINSSRISKRFDKALRIKCALVRDEIYVNLKEWLREGAIPPDAALSRDLTTPQFDTSVTGELKIEVKKQLRDRIGRSTDGGDSLGLACLPRQSLEKWSPNGSVTTWGTH